MKRIALVLGVSLFLVMGIRGLYGIAAEHGGKEHGGKEHGGKEHGGAVIMKPSDKDIQKAMTDYVKEKSASTGTFEVYDDETGKTRKLSLVRVHERVGKTGDYYYSCADFKDADTGETLDLDIDIKDDAGKLGVADVRIHKVNGKERYTYDEKDNRIPVKK
ncbi:MAG: hypothetical protein HY589_02235 [Candidatus Omnitrophica bacterium]|nr:hypothetical protein [Candidatus Omnitrophota bacterium]